MTHRSWVGKNGELVSQPTLTVEELKAIVDEAHGWGKKVACHAYNGIGLQRALDGGCDSLEHGLEITDAQIAQMVKQGTWYCATLAPYYRLHQYADYVAAANRMKLPLENFEHYFETFKFGMPPHGGFAIGLERFVMQLLCLDNIRLATLFPRDIHRLEP